jgi:transposase
MRRYALRDDQWERIKDLLPKAAVHRMDKRHTSKVIDSPASVHSHLQNLLCN